MSSHNSNSHIINFNSCVEEVISTPLSSEGSLSTSSDASSNVSYDGNIADTDRTSISSDDVSGSDASSDMDVDSDLDSDIDSVAVSDTESDLESEMDEDTDGNVDEDIDGDIDENVVESVTADAVEDVAGEENDDEDTKDHMDIDTYDGNSTTSTGTLSEDKYGKGMSEDSLNNVAEKNLKILIDTLLDSLSTGQAPEILIELHTSAIPSSTENAMNEINSDMEIQNYLREDIVIESAWLEIKRPHPRAFFKFSFVQEVMALSYSEQAVYHKFNRGMIDGK